VTVRVLHLHGYVNRELKACMKKVYHNSETAEGAFPYLSSMTFLISFLLGVLLTFPDLSYILCVEFTHLDMLPTSWTPR
jgi:hypothetical protein